MTYESDSTSILDPGPILTALADPTRRAIFEGLRQGPRPVGELATGLPVSRPAVSQHLRVLKDARLVREEKRGTRRFYSLDPAGLEPLRRYLDGFWADVLESFKRVAEAPEDGGSEDGGSEDGGSDDGHYPKQPT